MNAVTQARAESVPALSMSEAELIEVLRNSLYPGASDGSIKMVVGYCKASGLDPMQKPAHIVPIWNAKTKQMQDVVMPGIGLYRTQAARSGQYAGVTEPEFGPDVTETLDGVVITYPSWCRVTVKRLLSNGVMVDFTAKELWKENYATQKRDSDAPNAMWKRRPYAQLAKCSEAQALRKAFPEFGAAPTAEEMDGKSIDEPRDVTPSAAPKEQPKELPSYEQVKFESMLPTWQKGVDDGKTTPEDLIAFLQSRYTLSAEQIERIKQMAPIEGEVQQ